MSSSMSRRGSRRRGAAGLVGRTINGVASALACRIWPFGGPSVRRCLDSPRSDLESCMRKHSAVFLALLVFRAAVGLAALPAGIQEVTSVEGITEYRLANGLMVLLFPEPSKQMITVNVTVLVGSGSEGYGETGMAHLLEHMV